MRRITAAAIALSMTLSAAPLFAAQAGTSAILGTAKTSAGKTVSNTTVRLRNTSTNQIAATTASNASGAFGFSVAAFMMCAIASLSRPRRRSSAPTFMCAR